MQGASSGSFCSLPICAPVTVFFWIRTQAPAPPQRLTQQSATSLDLERADWRQTSKTGKQQQRWTGRMSSPGRWEDILTGAVGSGRARLTFRTRLYRLIFFVFFVFAVCFMSSDSKTDVMRQTKQFLDLNYSDESCLKLESDASEHFALWPITFLNLIKAASLN